MHPPISRFEDAIVPNEPVLRVNKALVTPFRRFGIAPHLISFLSWRKGSIPAPATRCWILFYRRPAQGSHKACVGLFNLAHAPQPVIKIPPVRPTRSWHPHYITSAKTDLSSVFIRRPDARGLFDIGSCPNAHAIGNRPIGDAPHVTTQDGCHASFAEALSLRNLAKRKPLSTHCYDPIVSFHVRHCELRYRNSRYQGAAQLAFGFATAGGVAGFGAGLVPAGFVGAGAVLHPLLIIAD
ncbi:hypothetical protein PMI07_002347 [Rhizobium sp. CF080]|nr:hypothetical protein PMI07_002347 [Rhizobium sp. CF080]